MGKIHGNTDSVKKSVLEELEALYDAEILKSELIPLNIYETIFNSSEKLNREIAVYLDRRGNLVSVAIGDNNKVDLPEIGGKRDERRLSGIRCIHTHPSASGKLSDVDLGTLSNLRLDAMIAIGLKDGSIFVGSLERNEKGELKDQRVSGPFFLPKDSERLNSFFEIINTTDKEASRLSDTDEIAEKGERAILVGLSLPGSEYDGTESLAELEELAKTAGAEVKKRILQKKERADSAFYVGRGKAEELSLMRQALDVNLIIFDDELSGAQIRNLEAITGARVIDRTSLILDIFAQRAKSTEGKLQVELAQMKYMLPRLTGRGVAMSRLGGGIGTRGPGETKLETDRRHINRRIKAIERQLAEVGNRRGELRNARKRNAVPTAALAGYTNAGKSTIMNYLCPAADVFAEDMLFATLDSTVRKLKDPKNIGREALLSDTVGFIRKLPHDLVEAFKSTLEETVFADLILHVVDASNERFLEHMEVVDKILCSIGAEKTPVFIVFNKIDKAPSDFRIPVEYKSSFGENKGVRTFCVSAKTGEGMEQLAEAIFENLLIYRKKAVFCIPFSEGGILSALHESGGVQKTEYGEKGVIVEAIVSGEILGRYKKYEIDGRGN